MGLMVYPGSIPGSPNKYTRRKQHFMLDYKELTAIAFAHAITSSTADSADFPFKVFQNAYYRAIDAMTLLEHNADACDLDDLYHENHSKEKQLTTRFIIDLDGDEGVVAKGYAECINDPHEAARFAACNPNAKIKLLRI